jgi:hypothetical protein
MPTTRQGQGRIRRLGVVLVLTLFVLLGMGIAPLTYSTFSWQALGDPYGVGQACGAPGQCATGYCTDGVCCESACGGVGESCNVLGRAGICTTLSPAPVLSLTGQILAVAALLLGGWFGLFLRRHDS